MFLLSNKIFSSTISKTSHNDMLFLYTLTTQARSRSKLQDKAQCMDELTGSKQGCGSGYFSNASASASTPIASASTNKKRKNDR